MGTEFNLISLNDYSAALSNTIVVLWVKPKLLISSVLIRNKKNPELPSATARKFGKKLSWDTQVKGIEKECERMKGRRQIYEKDKLLETKG
jgi:hypothetical protein